MSYKLKDNRIINGDIISPDYVYATFSDEIPDFTKHRLVNTLKFGDEMLRLYRKHKGNLDIVGIHALLDEMAYIYREYEYQCIEATA